MSVQGIRRTVLKTIALLIILVIIIPGWTLIVTGEVHISPRYHNRYAGKMINHQFIHSPTAASYLKSRSTNSSSSSSSDGNSPPPTRVFYKPLAAKDVRRNGSTDDVPLVRRLPPPDTNPWFTLYRPSSPSPQYAHRTKKPVEISWKPAHVVLDELPIKGPLPRFQQDTNSNPHLHPKDYYRHLYGTHEGVKYLKGNYGPTNLPEAKDHLGMSQGLEDVRLANEHFLKMRSGGRCKVPVPEVVCVKDLYPNSTKEYLPRCTLLHRCGDRSGCCESDALSCVPRAMQEIALNFYVVQSDLPASQVGLENSVEKLLFTNHTECECVPNPTTSPAVPTNEPAQNQADSQDPEDTLPPPTLLEDDHKELKELRGSEIQHEEEDHRDSKEDKPNHKCRDCPEPFHRRHFSDGLCSCDCFDKQKPCLKIKRGNGPLAEHEKRCVESNMCNIPDCEFGAYVASTGRCPKKNGRHRNGLYNNPRSLHDPKHRQAYFERD